MTGHPFVPGAPTAGGTRVCGLWPFAAGSSRPVVRVPSALLLGNPHLGKSSLATRLMIGLSYRGVRPMVPGDTKNEQ